MSRNTVPLLLDHGILQVGDVLEVDRESFRNSEKVPSVKIEARTDDESFWRCQITERTTKDQKVKYLQNNRYYRLTPLTTLIAERLGAEDYNPRAVDYWLHPQHGDMSLWKIREQL